MENNTVNLTNDEKKILAEAIILLRRLEEEDHSNRCNGALDKKDEFSYAFYDTAIRLEYALRYRTDIEFPEDEKYEITFEDFLHYHSERPLEMP